MTSTNATKLTRDLNESMLGGVLSGIALRYNWDPTLLRLVAALVALATGIIPAILVYIAAWVLIPLPDDVAAQPSADPVAADELPPAEEPPPTEAAASGSSPANVADEIAVALRDAAERLGEAATIAGEAARQAANEIGEVARRPRAAASDTPEVEATPAPEASTAPAPEASTAPAPEAGRAERESSAEQAAATDQPDAPDSTESTERS